MVLREVRKALRSPGDKPSASGDGRTSSIWQGGGREGARRAALGDGREAGTFYRTSGMSWKSALESSVPMESAMKNVRTRLKKAFSEHGTMKTPSREATLIIDTLRKPKPHTAEREETRARHYRGSRRGEAGRDPQTPDPGGWKGWLRLHAPARRSVSPCAPDASTATQTVSVVAGQVEMKAPGCLEEAYPEPAWERPALCSGQPPQDLRHRQLLDAWELV